MKVTWGRATVTKAEAPHPVVSHEDKPSHPVKKVDQEQQIVWGEVYVPDVPDSQNDFMTAASIREMAYRFMQKGDMFAIDTGHDQEKNGSYIVESFIARDGDPNFIPGSWVLGVKVEDPEKWAMVKSGELNGFSVDGRAMQEDVVLVIDVPEVITGRTTSSVDHDHEFYVRFGEDGKINGYTDPGPDGFSHKILRGTMTEEANGHSHLFSFAELILGVELAS